MITEFNMHKFKDCFILKEGVPINYLHLIVDIKFWKSHYGNDRKYILDTILIPYYDQSLDIAPIYIKELYFTSEEFEIETLFTPDMLFKYHKKVCVKIYETSKSVTSDDFWNKIYTTLDTSDVATYIESKKYNI